MLTPGSRVYSRFVTLNPIWRSCIYPHDDVFQEYNIPQSMYVGLCKPCITDEEIGDSGGNMRMRHFVETEFWLVEREVYAILGNIFFHHDAWNDLRYQAAKSTTLREYIPGIANMNGMDVTLCQMCFEPCNAVVFKSRWNARYVTFMGLIVYSHSFISS